MAMGATPGWWERLGGPNAMSMPAWLLTLPGAILTTPTLSDSPTREQTLDWYVLGGLAHVLCGLVFFAAWLTVLRPGPRPARPWVFVGVVILAGMLRGLFLGMLSVPWGLASSMDLPLRMTAAPWALLLWLSLATLIVDGSRRHRAAMDRLRRALEREQELAAQSATHLREHRERIVAQVSDTVATQLVGAAALAADPQRAASHLQHIVSDVVRPLSHELEWRTVQDDRLIQEVAEAGDIAPIPLRDYVEAAVTHRPFVPLLTGALVLGSSTILILYSLGPMLGMLCLVVDLLAVVAATVVARSLLMPHLPEWSMGRRLAVVSSTFVTISLLDGLAVVGFLTLAQATPRIDEPISVVVTLVTAAAVALGAQLASATVGAVSSRRELSEQELKEATQSAEVALSRLRQRAFVEQQQLSRLLHGDVQARIVSLALQLQLDPPPDPVAAVADLDRRIRQSLGGEGRTSWQDDVLELSDMWAHAIDLSVHIDPDAVRHLDRDAIAAQATIAVVREAVTNAVRHGQADHVRVDISMDDPLIVVDVEDDGASSAKQHLPGMGTRTYDSVCLDWRLDTNPRGHLRARIAAGSFDDNATARTGGAVR